ncbi:Hypothetical_protein [Hexamita inflata]|uniref:Hypothetical_protein n=1 Tax=Hexamita inflata TaxID=28002 RepID=A0AA86U0T0_9EUKA|nr:Hypothetical protein HINF_LOCUS25095 [Hexamita inflata]
MLLMLMCGRRLFWITSHLWPNLTRASRKTRSSGSVHLWQLMYGVGNTQRYQFNWQIQTNYNTQIQKQYVLDLIQRFVVFVVSQNYRYVLTQLFSVFIKQI